MINWHNFLLVLNEIKLESYFAFFHEGTKTLPHFATHTNTQNVVILFTFACWCVYVYWSIM